MQLKMESDVRAPVDLVFGVISAAERLPEWNVAVEAARRLEPGPVGPGSRALFRGTVLGQTLEAETVVLECTPPRRFVTRAVRGPRLDTLFELESAAFGTHLRVDVRGDVPGGRLGGLVAERLLRAQLSASLNKLGRLCERESAEGAAQRSSHEGGDPACWAHLQRDAS